VWLVAEVPSNPRVISNVVPAALVTLTSSMFESPKFTAIVYGYEVGRPAASESCMLAAPALIVTLRVLGVAVEE
jgi:hypothetical protein